MPAQLTATRRGPSAEAWSMAACTWSASVTSAGANSAASPISSSRALPLSASRSRITARAPLPISRRTVASPSPEAPPVTTAAAPWMSMTRDYRGRTSVVTVFVGTSGWQYQSWKGRFYPRPLAQSAWLEYFADRFRTVEINNTFYRLPERDVFDRLAQRKPDDFVLA